MEAINHTEGNNRQWHASFLKYVEFMAAHPNYEGLFYERDSGGRIRWVVTGISEDGRERKKWWVEQCKKHGIKIEPGAYAKIAVKIHPTKKHTCQICGKELSVEYVYPGSRVLGLINMHFNVAFEPFLSDIFEIIDVVIKGEDDIEKFRHIFRIAEEIKLSKDTLKKYIKENFVDTSAKGWLSPGVMSNSPDRFDGFHSDGACCRSQSDRGRHMDNLLRYGQDRRVYENWADGDWKKADRLMSEFRKWDVSADHIGPISLGFCHRPKFHPLTKSANSAKNNRMSLADVKVLIEDEKKEQVVSWHSKFIWDKLKGKVQSDSDAIKLSDLMRKNLHHVLILFSMIEEKGYSAFLETFLNPQYSFFDYTFEGFDPNTGTYEKAVRKELTGRNQQNNVERYKRIAFEKLKEYKKVGNRKVNIWKSKEVDILVEEIFVQLNAGDFEKAKSALCNSLSMLAEIASESW